MNGPRRTGLRRRLLTAPWWALALVQGGIFGGLWLPYLRFVEDASWPEAVLLALLCGAAFGLVMGRWQHRQSAQLLEAAGDPSGEELSRLPWRWRSTVPEDPAQRQRALAVVAHQERLLRRQRPWALPFLALMLVLAVWSALEVSAWWWAGAAFWAVVLALHLLLPGRLRRYAERLRAEP